MSARFRREIESVRFVPYAVRIRTFEFSVAHISFELEPELYATWVRRSIFLSPNMHEAGLVRDGTGSKEFTLIAPSFVTVAASAASSPVHCRLFHLTFPLNLLSQ